MGTKDLALNSLKDGSGKFVSDFRRLVHKEIPHWCVSEDRASLKLCRWVIENAAEACLPHGHPQLKASGGKGQKDFPYAAEIPEGCVARDPSRAYWITLGDRAVRQLIQLMDSVDWDADLAVSK